jgi:hypothetical protein
VVLHNIRGFLYNANPFDQINLNTTTNRKSPVELKIYDSKFEFYESQVDKLSSKCNKYELINRGSFTKTVLSSFATVSLNKNMVYASDLCPFVFQNVKLDLLVINDINDANRLTFKTVSLTEYDYRNANFSITINQLYLFNANLTLLDESLLSRTVFSSLKTLQIYGNLNEIQSDLFSGASFKNLKSLVLDLFNFEQFIRNKNNDWMSSLTSLTTKQTNNSTPSPKSAVHFSRINLLIHLNDHRETFLYDETDFCLFAKFRTASARSVYALIKTKEDLNCTCTLVWLVKDYRNFVTRRQQLELFKTKSVAKCLDDFSPRFEQFVTGCYFEERLQVCLNATNKSSLLEPARTVESQPTLPVDNNRHLLQALEILSPLLQVTNNSSVNSTTTGSLSSMSSRALAFLIGAFGFMSTIFSIVLALL